MSCVCCGAAVSQGHLKPQSTVCSWARHAGACELWRRVIVFFTVRFVWDILCQKEDGDLKWVKVQQACPLNRFIFFLLHIWMMMKWCPGMPVCYFNVCSTFYISIRAAWFWTHLRYVQYCNADIIVTLLKAVVSKLWYCTTGDTWDSSGDTHAHRQSTLLILIGYCLFYLLLCIPCVSIEDFFVIYTCFITSSNIISSNLHLLKTLFRTGLGMISSLSRPDGTVLVVLGMESLSTTEVKTPIIKTRAQVIWILWGWEWNEGVWTGQKVMANISISILFQ